MDHSDHGDSTTSNAHDMMIPYLHFQGGDYLFFKPWTPSSPGAIAGACLGLVVLALFERWLAVTRATFSAQWNQKAFALAAARDRALAARISSGDGTSSVSKGSGGTTGVQEVSREAVDRPPAVTIPKRTIPPFNLQYDLPRGILFALQSLVGYLLMLAVMSAQAAYLISIVLGLGLGEIFFGRMIPQDMSH